MVGLDPLQSRVLGCRGARGSYARIRLGRSVLCHGVDDNLGQRHYDSRVSISEASW